MPGVIAWLRLSRPSTKGRAAAPIGAKNLALSVFRDMAGRDQPRHRHRRVGDAAESVGKTEIVHAHVAGIEARMDMDERAGLVGRLPERVEIGGIERRADAARQRADHGAGKARLHCVLEDSSCARAVAERHGRQRHEMRLGFGGGEQASLVSRLQASLSARGSS